MLEIEDQKLEQEDPDGKNIKRVHLMYQSSGLCALGVQPPFLQNSTGKCVVQVVICPPGPMLVYEYPGQVVPQYSPSPRCSWPLDVEEYGCY